MITTTVESDLAASTPAHAAASERTSCGSQVSRESGVLQPAATQERIRGYCPAVASLTPGRGAARSAAAPPHLPTIAGRRLPPSPVFDTYWRFAAARQAIYLARLAGRPSPWTDDPILAQYRFTNVYRAADRVSQFLISRVIYARGAPTEPEDVVFRILLFKLFNKIETWCALEHALGEVSWRSYDFDRYRRVLDDAAMRGPIYSAAYVIPPPRLGELQKRLNHLRLLERMMHDRLTGTILASRRLRETYDALLTYPSMGPFLAFQFTIDLNYSPLLTNDENEFVVAGPGAVDGIRKCFGPASRGIESEIIRYMVETQGEHFGRLGLDFAGLFGRPLHLIDCQNLFCEVDKYARVAHPEVQGRSRRFRIKQSFRRNVEGLSATFPPKWGLASVDDVQEPPPAPSPLTLFS